VIYNVSLIFTVVTVDKSNASSTDSLIVNITISCFLAVVFSVVFDDLPESLKAFFVFTPVDMLKSYK